MLIFDAGDVSGLDVLGIRLLRALRREKSVLVVKIVDQKAGGQDIAAGEIALKLGEIADAERMIVVGADWELGEDRVVVLAVEGVVEPDFSFHDRAGKSEARKELVEAPSVLVLHGGNEVGGEETEVIVADAGVKAEKAAGPLPASAGSREGST